MKWTETIACKSGHHCEACQNDTAFRTSVVARHGEFVCPGRRQSGQPRAQEIILQPIDISIASGTACTGTMPKHTDWCHRFHAVTNPKHCAACKNPSTHVEIVRKMLSAQRPACIHIEPTGEKETCTSCGGKVVEVPIYRCGRTGKTLISPGECLVCSTYEPKLA